MKFPSIHFFRDRRSKERFWVILLFLLVIFFGFLEGWFFQLQPDLPLSGNVFLFALINLNVILLLLLAYLVLRNIVKLLFERKRNLLGTKLKTRLVAAFVGLSLIPTLPLFWLATQFIFSSLEYWFSHRVEQSLKESVTFAKDYLEQEKKDFLADAQMAGGELPAFLDHHDAVPTPREQALGTLLQRYHLDALWLMDSSGNLIREARRKDAPKIDPTTIKSVGTSGAGDSPQVLTITFDKKREALGVQLECPLGDPSHPEATGRLLALRVFPEHITDQLRAMGLGYEDYLQLKLLHKPLKRSHFITFSIITLLVVFGAIWFAFFLARSITVPIETLVSATQSVADGDLSLQVDTDRLDEIGMLMTSFNKMVHDLREGREQLDTAYAALQQSHTELEDRRRYMEIVLRNIAAGVVSIDAEGAIVTMNKSAENTFGLQADQVRGRLYSEILHPPHLAIVKSFVDTYRLSRQPFLEQQVQVIIGNRPMVLLIKVSILRDDRNQYLGAVVVLDDLTDLEKAQRMAAWREVARRIAHEIKNPLTPIKLSAQRLRRKHTDLATMGGSIFDQCTRTIIEQVEHMKHLVNEFSKFARLPRAQPTLCNLSGILEEVLIFYQHTYPRVSFRLEKDENLPSLKLDRDQFKQVMINLLDNALHAMDGGRGAIIISLFYDPILKIARLECADNGHGISPEDKLRMFEPYYSKKEKGTGLGLAIVASIIADHNGFVRVRDNQPQGTVIIIELPG
jgi:two-component system, NtrC family, nitrogen regulation sensor histidine kinase NtrY